MASRIGLLLLAFSSFAFPASAEPLFEEDFSSGWSDGQMVTEQDKSWWTEFESPGDFLVREGPPAFLEFSAGGEDKVLYLNTPFPVTPGEVVRASMAIRSNSFGGGEGRGVFEVRMVAHEGQGLVSATLVARPSGESEFFAQACDGFALPELHASLTLSEALLPEVWYSLELTYDRGEESVGAILRNGESVVAEFAGPLGAGSQEMPTVRGLALRSGTFGGERSIFEIRDFVIETQFE